MLLNSGSTSENSVNSGVISRAISINSSINSRANSVNSNIDLNVNSNVNSNVDFNIDSRAPSINSNVDFNIDSNVNSNVDLGVNSRAHSVDSGLDSEDAEFEAIHLKRQESTDWRSIAPKYLALYSDLTPKHSEELNDIGQKEVFDAVLNKDGYLYHSQQEGRSKRIIDPFKLAGNIALKREARKLIAHVPIPPLSPLPNRHKRPSKKQRQLDQEAEIERQEQWEREYREMLAEDKYLELKEAERQREEAQKQARKAWLERWQKRGTK